MNGTKNSGGGMNLSGGRGSPYEMEPWAYEARGRNRGLEQGRRQGREEGYSDGRSKGRSEGYVSGRSEGFDAGLLGGIEIGRNQAWEEAGAIIGKEQERSNQLVVYVIAMRYALETLMDKNPNSAHYIRKLFKERYEKESIKSIAAGELRTPPHESPEFYKYSPAMKRFILQALT